VSGVDAGLWARIEIAPGGGHAGAHRSLSSPNRDCRELTDAIVLALSIAINPLLALQPAPSGADLSAAPVPQELGPASPPLTTTNPPPPPAPPASATAPPSGASRPPGIAVVSPPNAVPPSREVFFAAAALAAAGMGPEPTLGGAVTVGARTERLAIELEGRTIMPTSLSVAAGRGVISVASLSLAPCARFGNFAACTVAGVGAVRARGEGFAITQSITLPTVALGGRVEWEERLAAHWALRASAQADILLARAHLQLNGAEVWVSPRVNGIAALALVLYLP
jgi:hypothetical protein